MGAVAVTQAERNEVRAAINLLDGQERSSDPHDEITLARRVLENVLGWRI